MLEEFYASRNEEGVVTFRGFDGYTDFVPIELKPDQAAGLNPYFVLASEVRPEHIRLVDAAQKDAAAARQEKLKAEEKKAAAVAQVHTVEQNLNNEITAHNSTKQTLTLRTEERDTAVTERNQLSDELATARTTIVESNNKIMQLLSGGMEKTAKDEMIMLYPEWAPGISVDSQEAYRIDLTLYISKVPHVTSDENSPTSANAATYWKGGSIQQPENPPPTPEFKYPKGTIQQYSGVDYIALEDTNNGPDAGYPTWDLAENHPGGV